ncbi:MAG: hypothetical protein ACJ76Q_04495 [Solirubrobacteraceae bacterium]
MATEAMDPGSGALPVRARAGAQGEARHRILIAATSVVADVATWR